MENVFIPPILTYLVLILTISELIISYYSGKYELFNQFQTFEVTVWYLGKRNKNYNKSLDYNILLQGQLVGKTQLTFSDLCPQSELESKGCDIIIFMLTIFVNLLTEF